MAEQFGRSTNAIHWHVPNAYNVWAHASPEQAERYLRPALRGELRDAYAVTERDAGSDPSRITSTAEPSSGGYVLNGEKWFVTSGDVASVLIVMANLLEGDRAAADPVPGRGRRRGCRDHRRTALHPQLPGRPPDDPPRLGRGAGGRGYRRGRQGRRAAAPLVHRGAARDRRPRDRCDVAAARGDGRLGAGARAGRQPDLRLPGSQLPARRLGRRRRRRAG